MSAGHALARRRAHIRAQAELIETQAAHIRILLGALWEKLDDMQGLTPVAAEAASAINCFTTCAMRNAALIEEEAAALYLEGDAS